MLCVVVTELCVTVSAVVEVMKSSFMTSEEEVKFTIRGLRFNILNFWHNGEDRCHKNKLRSVIFCISMFCSFIYTLGSGAYQWISVDY